MNPKRKLIVAGCAAERLKNSLRKRHPQIDLVIGAKSIEEFPKIILDHFLVPSPLSACHNLSRMSFPRKRESISPARLDSPVKPGNDKEESFDMASFKGKEAFVTIMRGCNYSCSYCVVPSVRGREISRPANSILEEVRKKAAAGKTRITLLGQTVNSYRVKEDGRTVDFSELLQRVEGIEPVEEIRFMSPHPYFMTDRLIGTLSRLHKISPEIHLPVQSGSNKILGLMKRTYTREKFIAVAQKLRGAVPNLALSTDFIVGFPGETQADFSETLSLMDEVQFSLAYSFKYSERPGTEAAKLKDDVPRQEKEERLAILLKKLGNSALNKDQFENPKIQKFENLLTF